jgi:hypothetical protein
MFLEIPAAPHDAPVHAIDVAYRNRTLGAVLIDCGDCFLAVGVQLSVFAYGEDAETALQTLAENASELYGTLCVDYNTDLASLVGRGHPAVAEMGVREYADRYIPTARGGNC